MFELHGKAALVTGATGGIGKAVARQLHAQGATVVLTGRREAVLQELAAELKERVHVLVCDLGNKEDVQTLFDRAEALAEKIDILICNAGVTRDNLVLRMKEEEWEEVIQTNLTASFILNKTAVKKMMKRKWGRIINITSVVATSGNPGQANYVASKAGVIGMTKAIAQEVAARGITLNTIAPGFIATPMTDVLTDAQKDAINKDIPAGKMGVPDDIASTVVYLASDEAHYVTGQTIHVNGGMLMV